MAQIVIPTNGSVGTPLLIEEKNLFGLDKVFGDFIAEKGTKADVGRSVTIYLSGGRTVKAVSFVDAIKQPHVADEEPLGFRAHLEIDGITASVSLTKLAPILIQPVSTTQFQTTQKMPQLEFNVEPSEKQSAQELFGALQNWAADFAPSTWMRRWGRYKLLFIILFAFSVISGLIYGSLESYAPGEDYREDARQILQKGVNDANQRKAIETILAFVSSRDTPGSYSTYRLRPDRRYWAIVVGVALALISLSICPSVVIGIWKGKPKVARWRAWIKWIFVTVPGVLIVSILIPKLMNWAGL